MPPTTLFGLGYGTGPAGYGYPPGARRPSISYPDSPFTWYDHVEITAALPTNGGGPITNYSVLSGSLPAGVSLNATTGELTGTPTTQQSAASVVIRARGPGGVSDTTISVEVLAMPLSLGSSLAAWYRADAGCFTDAACLFASASSQYLSKTSPTFAPTTKMTIAFDYKPTTVAADQDLVGQWASGNTKFIVRCTATGTVDVYVSSDAASDGGSNLFSTTAPVFSAGVNTRLVVVYDGTLAAANRVAVYADGSAVGGSVSGTIPAALSAGTAALTVGGIPAFTFANGALARLGFSSLALSGAALTAAHTSTFWADMTAARQADWFSFYNLCEASSTRVDSTGLNNLTPTNGPTVAAGPGEGACVDNSPCKRQEDQSGLGFHKTQATITKQPIWTASVHNGRPALVGDGANDLLVTSGDVFSTAYLRVAYALLTMPGSGSARGLGFGADVASVGDFGSGLNQWGYYANEAAGVVSLGGDLTRDIVGIEVASASSAEAYVNDGAATTFDPSATYDPATLRKWVSHCDDAAGSNPGAASISEEILMLAVPTTAQRASIKSYLNTRYAAY